MHQFNERHPIFKGFSEYYENTIRPYLGRGEVKVREVRKKVKYNVIIILLLTLSVVGLAVLLKAPLSVFVYVIVLGPALAFVYSRSNFRPIALDVKTVLMFGMTEFLGWEHEEKCGVPPTFEYLKKRGFFEKYNRSSFEDKISGSADGVDFSMTEVKLHHQGQYFNTHSFEGIILTIDFPRDFFGETILIQRSGLLGPFQRRGLKDVGLVSLEFEKRFTAYSNDQVEARYLLPPDFIEDLTRLENSVSGQNLRLAFWKNQLHIVIDVFDQFEVKNLKIPVDDPSRMQGFIDEIVSILHIIEGVKHQPSRA